MGLPKSSLMTYLAWTDAMQRMQRLFPSPLRGMRRRAGILCRGRDPGGGGEEGEVGGRMGHAHTLRTDGRRPRADDQSRTTPARPDSGGRSDIIHNVLRTRREESTGVVQCQGCVACGLRRSGGSHDGMESPRKMQRLKYRFPRRADPSFDPHFLCRIQYVAAKPPDGWVPLHLGDGCPWRPKHTIITKFSVSASFCWRLILVARLLVARGKEMVKS